MAGGALALSGLLAGCGTNKPAYPLSRAASPELTKQISAVLIECQKIRHGMTRAELLKIFTTECGISTAVGRTYIYRGCPYVKVNVHFTSSDPKQKMVEERPTDIISKISKPYLEWSIID